MPAKTPRRYSPHQRSLISTFSMMRISEPRPLTCNARRADAAAYLVALVIELVDSALIVGLDGRQTGGHGQRVGAECASPRDLRTALGVKCGHDVGASSKGADRKATADQLAERGEIGGDAIGGTKAA